MALVRGAPQLLVETGSRGSIGYEGRMGRTVGLADRPYPISGFSPRLLSGLAASSTAACTSGVVTVTATGHAIPATTFNGYQFYYPGSPSLAAGWYASFSRTEANSLTFAAPGTADFTSESVNGGAAFTSAVDFESFVMPADTLSVGDRVTIQTYRASNNTASTKTLALKIGANAVVTNASTSTTLLCGTTDFAFVVDSVATAVGHAAVVGTLGSAVTQVAADITADLTISLTGQVSVASVYIAMIAAKVRID